MRQQQLESEQFLFFEDQLKKQELARGQTRGQDSPVLSEQTDGSGLSCFSTHQNNSLRNVFADQPRKSDGSDFADHSPPVNRALKPAATLSAVQSKSLGRRRTAFCLLTLQSSPPNLSDYRAVIVCYWIEILNEKSKHLFSFFVFYSRRTYILKGNTHWGLQKEGTEELVAETLAQ